MARIVSSLFVLAGIVHPVEGQWKQTEYRSLKEVDPKLAKLIIELKKQEARYQNLSVSVGFKSISTSGVPRVMRYGTRDEHSFGKYYSRSDDIRDSEVKRPNPGEFRQLVKHEYFDGTNLWRTLARSGSMTLGKFVPPRILPHQWAYSFPGRRVAHWRGGDLLSQRFLVKIDRDGLAWKFTYLGKKEIDGRTAEVIEAIQTGAGDKTRYRTRFWLSRDHNLLPIKIEQDYAPAGKPFRKSQRSEVSEYRKIGGTLWLPGKWRKVSFDVSKPNDVAGHSEFQGELRKVKRLKAKSADFRPVSFPAGARVSVYQAGKHIGSFRTPRAGTLSAEQAMKFLNAEK